VDPASRSGIDASSTMSAHPPPPTRHLTARTRLLNLGRRLAAFGPLERLVCGVTRGTVVGSLRARCAPNYYQFDEGTRRTGVDHEGLAYDVDIGTLQGWAWHFGIEDPGLRRLYAMVRPGDSVVDVGANIGEVSLRCARRAGPHGHVLAVEPFPPTFRSLRRNVELNPELPATPVELALGRRRGEAAMYVHQPGNPGANRIDGGTAGPGSGTNDATTAVAVTTLDEVVSRRGIDRIDLLKIDTEGYEMHVLAGAAATVSRFFPAIYLELSDANLRAQGATPAQVLRWLQERGYGLQEAVSGAPVHPDSDLGGVHIDVVARPTPATPAVHPS
jgi:FkbM family methyltransferase